MFLAAFLCTKVFWNIKNMPHANQMLLIYLILAKFATYERKTDVHDISVWDTEVQLYMIMVSCG